MPEWEFDGSEEYSDFEEEFGYLYDIEDDPVGMGLMHAGWFSDNSETTPEERHDAREAWFEYMDYDYEDFDWDAWREYMGYD